MADPVTWAIIASVAATATGATVAAVGQHQAGKAEDKAQKRNAAIQMQQAANERKAALYQAEQISEEGQKLKARQNVLFSKAGVGLAGTPLLVIQDTQKAVEQDIRMSILGGTQRAGYYEAGAGLSLLRGKSAMKAGVIGAGGSLLSGAADSIYRYRSLTTL